MSSAPIGRGVEIDATGNGVATTSGAEALPPARRKLRSRDGPPTISTT